MDYKEYERTLTEELIGNEQDVNSIKNSYFYKLKNNIWDEEQYKRCVKLLDEFGAKFAEDESVPREARGVIELYSMLLADTMLYLDKHDPEKLSWEYEKLLTLIGNNRE